MSWAEELAVAERAVRAAGRVLVHDRHSGNVVESARGKDIKLRADRLAEAEVLKILRAESRHAVLAEESGLHDGSSEDVAWVVDPLDGTLNYSRGIGLCCVSVGLWRGTEPILGVILDFNRDELFSGIVGEGCSLNGSPATVSTTERAAAAVLTTGFPVNRDFAGDSLQAFLRQIQDFKKIRLLGSAALSLAYVACGRADAYFEEDIMHWDVAAGIALVRAAGGCTEVAFSSQRRFACTVRAASQLGILRELGASNVEGG